MLAAIPLSRRTTAPAASAPAAASNPARTLAGKLGTVFCSSASGRPAITIGFSIGQQVCHAAA